MGVIYFALSLADIDYDYKAAAVMSPLHIYHKFTCVLKLTHPRPVLSQEIKLIGFKTKLSPGKNDSTD